jgi:RHS repeat-associated protein
MTDTFECRGVCHANYPDATAVTIWALPDLGAMFVGWSGDCTGPNLGQVVSLTANRSCTATFTGPAPAGSKLSPADGAAVPGTSAVLTWDEIPTDTNYYVCVADDPVVTSCAAWFWAGSPSPQVDGLPGGDHYWTVRVNTPAGRFDLNGASWKFTTPIPADHWKAEYFANVGLEGTPARIRDEGTGPLDHWWNQGGPPGLPVDNFSSRFTRTVTFAAGRYLFTLFQDDGARLYIDDQLRIDGWNIPYWQHDAEIDLTGGPHVLKVEHHEHTGAAWARLDWTEIPTAPTAPTGGPPAAPAAEQTAPAAIATPRGAGPLGGAGTWPSGAARAIADPGAPSLSGTDAHDGEVSATGAAGPCSPPSPSEAPALAGAAPRVPTPTPPTVTEIVEYYHLDALGSVRVVTDEAGAVVRHHDFLPFGEEWQPEVPPSADKRLFTGKERDVESGLDYFGARYYRADLGRFTTVDPVGISPLHMVNPQRFNRYGYAVGNPFTFIDPDVRDAIVVNFSQGGGGYGHQGVIVVRSNGSATFSDYGPIKPGGPKVQPGIVYKVDLPVHVTFDSRGLPTLESLESLAKYFEKLEN